MSNSPGPHPKNFRIAIAYFALIAILLLLLIFISRSSNQYALGAGEYLQPINDNHPYPEPKINLILSPTPSIAQVLIEATQYARKYGTPLAPEIIASANAIKLPTPVSITYFPVKSISDIPNVVFNDPFYGNPNHHDFGSCIQDKNPGLGQFVKSLDKEWRDYYISPFFNLEGKICGFYYIEVNNGMGTVIGWKEGRGNRFPPVDEQQARSLVEVKSGHKVIANPRLVFRLLREAMDPFSPFWQVLTDDGQTYFVIYVLGIKEQDQYETLSVNIYLLNNVHPIRP